MKRSIVSISVFATCLLALFIISSFNTIPSSTASNAPTFLNGGAVNFSSSGTSVEADGTTYIGNVTATGAINAQGTYVMPTEVIGSALHCTFILSFPNGTITIRMNCNLVTFKGVWKVLGGTGIYQNLKGGGSLIMPDDLEEYLFGTVRGI